MKIRNGFKKRNHTNRQMMRTSLRDFFADFTIILQTLACGKSMFQNLMNTR